MLIGHIGEQPLANFKPLTFFGGWKFSLSSSLLLTISRLFNNPSYTKIAFEELVCKNSSAR